MARAIRCDRCGAYFTNVNYTHLSTNIYYLHDLDKWDKAERADLCPDCASALYAWLNEFEEVEDER